MTSPGPAPPRGHQTPWSCGSPFRDRGSPARSGPSILWGVLPPGATSVEPHLEGGAKAGVPVLARLTEGGTVFAVMVQGDPDQVSGLDVTLGGGRGGLSRRQ